MLPVHYLLYHIFHLKDVVHPKLNIRIVIIPSINVPTTCPIRLYTLTEAYPASEKKIYVCCWIKWV